MSSDEPQLDRLAALVKHSREKVLRLTQDEIETIGGPSTPTQTKIENGRPPAPRLSTQRKLERVYGWAPGSVEEVLAGGDPTPLVAASPRDKLAAQGFDEAADEIADMPAEQIAREWNEALVLTGHDPVDMTPEEIRSAAVLLMRSLAMRARGGDGRAESAPTKQDVALASRDVALETRTDQ